MKMDSPSNIMIENIFAHNEHFFFGERHVDVTLTYETRSSNLQDRSKHDRYRLHIERYGLNIIYPS